MADIPIIPQVETDPAKIAQLKENAIYLSRALKQVREAEKCAKSLRDFVKHAWPMIGGNSIYMPNWHIDCLCEHLEAVMNRDIRQLLINMPPRSGKSSIISIALTAWRWIECPTEKFLTASYDLKLSRRDSRLAKNLIKSPWYSERWGHLFKISIDQGEKAHFENDKGGYRIATSTSAGTIGHGGSCRILDDPNNLKEINSKDIRENENSFYQIMCTRHVHAPTDVEICVQQRGHQMDMTGMLLGLGGWELLTLPNEYEGNNKPTCIGYRDPRTKFGELLHPERLGPLETEKLKKSLGQEYEGQYQQRPSALAGNQLKREWWKFWNPRYENMTPDQRVAAAKPITFKVGADTVEREAQQIPDAFEQVCQSWDCAFKDLDTSDYVAGHVWGRLGANCYLLDRDHGHYDFPKTVAAVRRMSNRYPCPEKLVEDKANGPAVIQTLRNEIPGLIGVTDAGGKVARVNAIAGYVEAGNVWLPNPNVYPWVWELLNEFSDFPSVEHDDDTDAMSQALKRLFDSMANTGLPEFRVSPRIGEPDNACHIEDEGSMMRSLAPRMRRWITVCPGHPGAVLWVAETNSGALRVYRELECLGKDAAQVGRMVAAASVPDVLSWASSIRPSGKLNIEVFMEKIAFAPVEPVGSYAALFEQGLLEYEPEHGEWDIRQMEKDALKSAQFSAQMANVEESSVDRLRTLLQFMPPDFEELEYDRGKAFRLAKENIQEYRKYMAAVEGKVDGEWPKLKISSQCKNLISSLGCCRREEQVDSPDPFLRALLIGVSAPAGLNIRKEPVIIPVASSNRGNLKFRVGRTR